MPGATYASGLGAPYLSTVGAPRKLAGAGIGAVGGALGRVALAAGTKAGTSAGKKVKPLKLRIGYLDIIGGIESADRAHNSLRVAFKRLGSTWIYCDGQGTPTKWATCGTSLLAQNIDVLALTGIDPSTIPSVVQAAKAKKVPIVDFGGTVGPGYAAQFAPNESKNGQILADYLKAKLASQSGVSNIVTIGYPTPWAQQRTAQLKSVVAANSSSEDLTVGDDRPDQPDRRHAEDRQRRADRRPERQGDLGRLRHRRPGGRSGRGEQVRRQDVPQQAARRHVPRRPEHQVLMRSGGIDAVVDNNYDATAWELANATAQLFAAARRTRSTARASSTRASVTRSCTRS